MTKEELRVIAREHPACATAPNATGQQCTCDYDCANYWLRANGYYDGTDVRLP